MIQTTITPPDNKHSLDMMVGQEGIINDMLSGTIRSLMDVLSTSRIFIDDIVAYRTKTPNIKRLAELQVDYIKIINVEDFNRVKNLPLPVTMGLVKSFKEVKDILSNHASYVRGLDEVLFNADKTISKIINGKAISKTVDKNEIKSLNKNTDYMQTNLATLTSTKKLSDRMKLSKAIKDFTEGNDVITETLKLGEVYKLENLEGTHSQVENLYSSIEVLIKIYDKNGDKIDKLLSEYIESLAKYVTSVAMNEFMYTQLVDMEIGLIKSLDLKNDGVFINSLAYAIRDGYKSMLKVFLG